MNPTATPDVPPAEELPNFVMFMPAGRHSAPFSNTKGEAAPATINVTEQTAKTLQNQVLAILTQKRFPFLDVSHDGKMAAAFIVRFFWVSQPAEEAGVWAELVWTGHGRHAVLEGGCWAVSPTFHFNKEKQIIEARADAQPNMGAVCVDPALHNRAILGEPPLNLDDILTVFDESSDLAPTHPQSTSVQPSTP